MVCFFFGFGAAWMRKPSSSYLSSSSSSPSVPMRWRFARSFSAFFDSHGRLESDVLDVLGLHQSKLLRGVLVRLVGSAHVHAVSRALLLHAEVELVGVAVRRLGLEDLDGILLLVEVSSAKHVIFLLLRASRTCGAPRAATAPCASCATALRSADMVKASRPSALGAGVSPVRWPGSERRGKGRRRRRPAIRCRDASHLGKFNQWGALLAPAMLVPGRRSRERPCAGGNYRTSRAPGGHEDPREPATRRAHPLAASFGPSRRRWPGRARGPRRIPREAVPARVSKGGDTWLPGATGPGRRGTGLGHPMMTTWSRRMSTSRRGARAPRAAT